MVVKCEGGGRMGLAGAVGAFGSSQDSELFKVKRLDMSLRECFVAAGFDGWC